MPPAANGDLAARGRRVRLECDSELAAGKPQVAVAYELADGDDFLTVITTWSNAGPTPLAVNLADRVRADRTFESAIDPAANLAWWDD